MPGTPYTRTERPDRSDQGDRLRAIRTVFTHHDGKPLQQAEFGQLLGGRTQNHVTQWERANDPRPAPAREIELTFGVSVSYVMGLTDYMWARSVDELCQAVKTRLASLPDDERTKLKSPIMDPAARIDWMVKLCKEINPDLFTDKYAALIMHITESELQEIVKGETYAHDRVYYRFAQWLELPHTWFEFGDAVLGTDPRMEPYLPILAQALAYGVTPEKLQQAIALITR